jgi:hypothetical protein
MPLTRRFGHPISSWYQSTRLLMVQVRVSVIRLIADLLGDEFLQIIELLVTS